MEFCAFHRGKQKLLKAEALEPGRDSATFLRNFETKYQKFVDAIDSRVDGVYARAVTEVVKFCENGNDYDYERVLAKALDVEPVVITDLHPLPLYDLQQILLLSQAFVLPFCYP
ncbi:unnamed protein product [Gongylonema pulchrum]|uniref:Uncharacterized protein n=1 Tax=Gongylonema pulchrum TaxID=637853 RepID=A0A183EQQ0_9BILA|nr:unnamed protein product [Gongylonema pulchrum]